MQFHTLSGLPRAGTTLLANLLSQHPEVYVSGTSALPQCIEKVANELSSSSEVTGELANVEGAYQKYNNVLRGMIENWYGDRAEPVCIDKARGWVMHRLLLDQVVPSAVSVVVVRDPRDVVASIEKQHRKTAVFNAPLARTVYETADLLMKPDGMIGGALRFIEDLIQRNLPVEFVRYETFVRDPATTMTRLQSRLNLSEHTWNFDNVENVATDLDALTRNKFPHDGSGAIKPTGTTWRGMFSDDLGEKIAKVAPLYMQTFGYR